MHFYELLGKYLVNKNSFYCGSFTLSLTTSLVAQTVKRLPTMEADPWVGKICWRRKWQPTPALLPGKSPGWRSLAGYSPWGHEESDTTEQVPFTALNPRLHLPLFFSGLPSHACACSAAQSCPTLSDPVAVALQAPLSMGFPRQEPWSGLPCPPPGDLPDPGIEPTSPAWQWILYHRAIREGTLLAECLKTKVVGFCPYGSDPACDG